MNPAYRRIMTEMITTGSDVPSVYGQRVYPWELLSPGGDVAKVRNPRKSPRKSTRATKSPVGQISYGGKLVNVYSNKGNYHHVSLKDSKLFKGIYSKTLSNTKGIKARVGVRKTAGARGGTTQIQSYLFDATKYSPKMVISWLKRHKIASIRDITVSDKTATRARFPNWERKSPRAKRKTTKRKTTKRKTTKKSSRKSGRKSRRSA